MQQVFCTIIKNKLINIANDTENRVLQQFLSQGRLTINHIMEGLNSPEYIKKNGASIAVPKYCEEYLLNTKEYKEFEAMFDKDFDRLLDNVYGMDKSGNMMPIRLNAKQKDIIQNQYLITFDNDIKQFFKEENDRFLKLFIADDLSEYERMLGDRYYFRADALEQYKSGKMCVINYGAMFDKSELDKLSRTNPNEFTTVNGDKFQNVLVFNNCAKELNLKPEQFVVKNNEQDIVRLDEDMPRNIPNSYNRQPPEQKAGRLPRMTETIRTHGMPPAD